MKLTPNTYLCDIGDQTILNPEVILTPVAWIAERLAGKKDFDIWKANGAKIFRGVSIHSTKTYDIVQCLPGASMALITMDEALSAGAKSFIFIGTCSSIKGRIRYGVLYQGSNIVSLLNPFEEHDLWQRIKMADVVDMEAKYLLKHAAKRSIRLQTILIVTDAIWKDRWERASFRSDGWKKTIKDSFNKLAKLLSEVV